MTPVDSRQSTWTSPSSTTDATSESSSSASSPAWSTSIVAAATDSSCGDDGRARARERRVEAAEALSDLLALGLDAGAREAALQLRRTLHHHDHPRRAGLAGGHRRAQVLDRVADRLARLQLVGHGGVRLLRDRILARNVLRALYVGGIAERRVGRLAVRVVRLRRSLGATGAGLGHALVARGTRPGPVPSSDQTAQPPAPHLDPRPGHYRCRSGQR